MKPSDVPFLKSVQVNRGSEINIVNISRGGLLLETVTRLGPDLKITIKLITTKGVFEMEGVTLRSSIFSLEGGPRYRTAIIFNDPFDLMDAFYSASPEREQTGEEGNTSEASSVKDGQQSQKDNPGNKEDKPPAILSVVASDANGVCLNESFGLNDW